MKKNVIINKNAPQCLQVSARGSLLATATLSLLLPGCAVGPKYQRPQVSAPTEYRSGEGAAQQASIADLPWWEVFKDPRLRELVQTALANNYDLRIAVTRIEQSRQIAAQARAQYFPFLNYGVTASDGKNEFVGGYHRTEVKRRGPLLPLQASPGRRISGAASAAKMKLHALSFLQPNKPGAPLCCLLSAMSLRPTSSF